MNRTYFEALKPFNVVAMEAALFLSVNCIRGRCSGSCQMPESDVSIQNDDRFKMCKMKGCLKLLV